MPAFAPMRWESYVLERGPAFRRFWAARFAELARERRRALLVVGLGFDPRVASAAEELVAAGGGGLVGACLVNYDEGEDSPSRQYGSHVQRNRARITSVILGSGGVVRVAEVPVIDDGRRVGGRHAAARVRDTFAFGEYEDLIVDISALPRSIYFPLLRGLLVSHDESVRAIRGGAAGLPDPANLHIVLHECAGFDACIREELTERADWLPGFSAKADMEQFRDQPRIWAPVLDERQEESLRRIEQKIKAGRDTLEICPVLPFPATNPRRGDELLIEYRRLFVEEWEIELRNIIYAAEDNPFDVYRELCRLHDRFNEALTPLRGAKMIASAHSSKVLSLGVLLAAHDREGIAVAHVESTGYHVTGTMTLPTAGTLCEMWVAGEPYLGPHMGRTGVIR
jgi:hypothetical protein